MAWVQAAEVVKAFGGVKAVDGVTFSVDEGEIVGLIGPNGSGKTTLVNLCTGVYTPTHGIVSVEGTPMRARTRGEAVERFNRNGVARTFQHPLVFDDLTVYENVLVGAERSQSAHPLAALLGTASGRAADRRARDRARECLRLVGLESVADAKASVLSQGLQHLLEIARALATDPRVIFLDEPAAGLNDAETEELAQTVRSVGELGIGVALVEHDVGFVLSLCQRICVLNFGRKIAEGSPDAIVADRAVVDAYLGTSGRGGIGLATDQ